MKVLITDRWSDYAVVQSTLHEVWARKYSGALKRDLRYSPTDCFATFPFPHDRTHEAPLAVIGEAYHEHRRALMRDLWIGLTDLYNLFHRPDLSDELTHAGRGVKAVIGGEEGLSSLLRVRELHITLDAAVLAAYGWDRAGDFGPAIALRHGFQALDYLPENDRIRFTIHPEARYEVLVRLLKLNHQRAGQTTPSVPTRAPRSAKKSTGTAPDLFDRALLETPSPREPDFNDSTLILPPSPRDPFVDPRIYAQTVFLKMIRQNGGVLAWPRVRQATRMLTRRHRDDLIDRGRVLFGPVVDQWRVHADDFFPDDALPSLLAGCYELRWLQAGMNGGNYTVELLDAAPDEPYPHVSVDAQLAVAVAALLPPDLDPTAVEEVTTLSAMVRR